MRKKLQFTSLICFISSLVIFAIDYVCFHYVLDTGFTSIKQEEAQKPFVTDLIGQFGTLFLFTAAIALIVSFVFFEKEKKEEKIAKEIAK